MENQVSTIVCPNCGASTTNGHNCDFCGSLLVRFVAENKEVDTITFGENAKEMEGLKDALKQNLSLPEKSRISMWPADVSQERIALMHLTG